MLLFCWDDRARTCIANFRTPNRLGQVDKLATTTPISLGSTKRIPFPPHPKPLTLAFNFYPDNRL